MVVETISDSHQLARLAIEWQCLLQNAPTASPFQTPEWLLTWWEHFGSGKLLLVAVRESGQLVGLAPLFLHPWESRRQITFLGNGVSDHLDVIAAAGRGPEAAACILEELHRCRGDWDLCDLQDLPRNSAFLGHPVPFGLLAEVTPQYACSVIPLPASVDEFRAALPHGLKRNLRRYREALDHTSSVTFETAGASAGDYFDALFELHRARWAAKDEHGMLHGAVMESFHRQAGCSMVRNGTGRLHAMRVNGAMAALTYVFHYQHRAYSYLGGFDPALSKYSPGALVLQYTIEQAIREQMTHFDFLRGSESYKAQWGALPDSSYRLRMTH